MPSFLDLSLHAPLDTAEHALNPVTPPPSVPSTLQDMGRALNDGIVVAEALEIDSAEALLCINSVWGLLSHIEVPCFTDEVLPSLRDWLGQVTTALRAGLDDEGLPQGAFGARLTRHSAIAADARGRLFVRGHARVLVELRDDLEALLRMIDFALEHHLWIALHQR
jgi:hypothetical protein